MESIIIDVFISLVMSNVRYGLLGWEEQIKIINYINVLIDKALKCINFKKHD